MVLALPLLVMGPLQLTGCVRRGVEVPPPGGIYRSTSAGAEYQQAVTLLDQAGEVIGNIATLSVRRLYRTDNPSVIYAIAGGQGIFFSNDSGQRWQQLEHPLAAATSLTRLANGILLVSGTNTDGEGIVVRSLDNGESWEEVLTIPALHRQKRQLFEIIKPPSPPPIYVADVVRDPFQLERVYATTSTGEVLLGEQFGKTWRNLFRVTAAERDPLTNQLIASIQSVVPSPHTADELLLVTTSSELVRLRAEGIERLELPDSGRIVDVTYVDQAPDSIFVATTSGALISRDRGVTWQELNLPISNAAPLRSMVVRVSPSNATRLLIAIDGIIYRSEDGGETFVTHSLGLPNHIITDISIDPANAANVLLATTPVQT